MKHENCHNEEYLDTKRVEAIDMAKSLIDGKTDLLTGVRSMLRLQYELCEEEDDYDFMIFSELDSLTHHLPSSESRDKCSRNWLEKCDQEVEELVKEYLRVVKDACQAIVSRYEITHNKRH